jgi:hypothetical protein
VPPQGEFVEVLEFLATPVRYKLAEFLWMVCEVKKGSTCRPFLADKQQRCRRGTNYKGARGRPRNRFFMRNLHLRGALMKVDVSST